MASEMRPPDRNETSIIGRWVSFNRSTQADDTCRRIDWLTTNYFEKLSVSKIFGAWETLYRDPSDDRLWEKTYPQSELHGGGPPALNHISFEDAKRKYDVPSN